uniref:Uncharacterized protein n=1 Tax=viral metagenome TaxID=1070528 RepID=A0A6M3IRQ2_9ZZZZ
MKELQIRCESTHQLYRHQGLKNLVEFLFRTPQGRRRAWKFVAFLRRNPWLEKKLRGELYWEQTVVEEGDNMPIYTTVEYKQED